MAFFFDHFAGHASVRGAALNLLQSIYTTFRMVQKKTRIQFVLDLSARLVERNKAFTLALKEKRSQDELKAIHSEIQEIYNHISSLNEAAPLPL
ncbi:hypothetical protein [Flavisolibacter nicotianae]|uniref:hypothetical protein n=1 Tax=Flavisolibacter nicotianae TaxID=2364882 RepID=UPI000EB19935|nr:hypothetical protein [Flavisolibacter nicotianae]